MSTLNQRTAWDVLLDEFVVIQAGDADRLRPLCKSGRLRCPVVDCPTPEITTRSGFTNAWGTFVTDGFRHLVAPDDLSHSPESLRHLDGKAIVAGWLIEQGVADVRTERTVRIGHTPQGRPRYRRPDVGGRQPNGQKIAFEVQVSSLDAGSWQDRTSDLRKRGWRVQWLWSWLNPTGQRALTTALRASVAAGEDVWFLDPDGDETGPLLGWGSQIRTVAGEDFQVRPFDFTIPIQFDWFPIGGVTVNGDGRLLRPGAVDDTDRLNAALLREAREQAMVRAEQQRQQLEQERAARRLRAEQERLARRRAIAAERDARMREHREADRAERLVRAQFRDQGEVTVDLDGDLEAVCRIENRADDRVWITASAWKRPVVARLLGSFANQEVPVQAVVDYVERNFPCNRGTVAPAVSALLYDLRRAKAIRLSGMTVTVLRPIRTRSPEQGALAIEDSSP